MRKIYTTLAVAALLLLTGAPAAQAVAAADIVVEDTAGSLDSKSLIPAIEEVNFNEPTKVVIYTRAGDPNDNLNEEVLRFAREAHPEWLSSNRQEWADSLFIFALDTSGRQVGTYFGEDRKVSPGQRDDIQESTKELLREAQWTDATIAGVERAAQLMNRPWYKSPVLYISTGILVVTGGISLGSTLAVRRIYRNRSKKALQTANTSYANVSMDLEVTELNAKTINSSSRYGSLVLEKYRGFMVAYTQLTKQSHAAEALTTKDLNNKRTALLLEKFAKKATELDRLDDVIADTNMLLNMGSGWGAAWDRQLVPLREDLTAIQQLLADKDSDPQSASALALSRFESLTAIQMDKWAADISSGELTPEDALDKIAASREELTELLKQHSETMIKKYAKTTKEAELMRTAMGSADASKASGASEHSILGTVYPSTRFWSVIGLTSGFRAGRSSVQESRSPSASSGGSTGYGSSGGSFSGSGSSSRF